MSINLSRIKEFVSEKDYEKADLYLSENGQNIALIYRIENKFYAQIGEKIFGGFDSIKDFAFRKNGKVFIFKYSTFSKKLGLIKDANQDYLNINGRILGPFSKIRDFFFNENLSYYLCYESFGKSYAVINNKKNGPFNHIYKIFISEDGKQYAYHIKEASRHYIIINENKYGGYEDVRSLHIDFSKEFMSFVAKKETGGYYVFINGNFTGPYDQCSDIQFHKDINTYFFGYKKDGRNFVQINKFVYGGFDNFSLIEINKDIVLISTIKNEELTYQLIIKGKNIYNNIQDYSLSKNRDKCIFSFSKMGQNYVNTSEKKFGPYSSVQELYISPDGNNFAFTFQKQYDNFYANINGDIYGPYFYITNVCINNHGNFGFIFTKSGKYYVNISDKIHGIYDTASNLILSDNGSGYTYMFTKKHKTKGFFTKTVTYLSMNGDITENNIHVKRYMLNSFGIEAKVFQNTGGWYIELNETVFGPFYSISHYNFLRDDSLFAFKYTEDPKDIPKLQINGRVYEPQNKNKQIFFPIFSNDNKKYTFLHYSQNHTYVQISEETYGPYNRASFPSFSPDSRIFVFKYEKDDGVYLNINGMDIGPFSKADYTFCKNKLFIAYLQDKMLFIDEITWMN